MHIQPRCLPGLAAGAVLILATLPLPAGRAAPASKEGSQVVVYLTDGFVLQGMDRREGKYELTGQEVVFTPSGFFFLDDIARQFFSSKLLRDIKPKPPTDEIKIYGKRDIRVVATPIPSVDEVLSATGWDEKWDRTVRFLGSLKGGLPRAMQVKQHLSELTPYYARTDATENYLWPAVYLTRELGPDVVRNLLSSNPDLAEDKTLAPEVLTARRIKYCDFMAQAGYYDEAENELTRLVDDNPSDKDVLAKAEAARVGLGHLRAREQFETIKQMHNAGQFKAVRKKLAEFNEKAADPQTLVDLTARRDEYKTAEKAMADAARLLEELPKNLSGGVYDSALREAAAAILADLQPDVLPRLDTFLGLARQAERQRADHQTPTAGATQLLSLAITGWLGALPDPSPDRAARLWRGRQFLVNYLAAENRDRKPLLEAYLGGRESKATIDELKQIIPLLPPSAPEAKITEEPVELTVGGGMNGAKYLVQLPPEYRHGRTYPVLMVLHQADEGPADMLKRWSAPTALNGYILVAPQWGKGLGGGYGYSEREHAVVLDTLRDLRRRFAVDSDRVFLFGLGQGGNMAFDVGLSHPDLFAGVLPMSGAPAFFAEKYYRNAQYLPFYIVNGDRSGDVDKHLRAKFEDWVSQYPMLWIQYKGRGVEWFGGEVPMMFDWMRGKQREFPLEGLGVEKDPMTKDIRLKPFTTQRGSDNSFYWATTDGILPNCINSETNWSNGVKAATLQAHIDLEKKTIRVETSGMNQVTLWLGSNGKGQDMIDFKAPLTVRWNSGKESADVWKDKLVVQSLDTLLEDLVRRGDRQRLFTAKLEFSTK